MLIPSVGGLGSGGTFPWSPADVGAYAWYDVQNAATLFADRFASSPASVDGPVGTMLDLSGNGFHLTAPADAQRPTLRNDGSFNYLDPDGTDDTLRNLSMSVTGTEFYLALAMQNVRTSINRRVASLNAASQLDWDSDERMQFGSGDPVTSLQVGRDGTQAAATVADGADIIYEAFAADTALTLGIDGADTEETHASKGSLNCTIFQLFAYTFTLTNSDPSQHKFYAGILINNSNPSGADRTNIRSWLAARMP